MVKVKRKSPAAKPSKSLKPNPFDVHVNKQKYRVLGQKSKDDRGLPGVSRAKGITKRKKQLLPEFASRDKANRFLDQRIGEKNGNLPDDERMLARFTHERIKIHKKKSIYNLGEDETLTHRGQTINEIERYDDERSDDDDERSGALKDTFVADAHFGGGFLSKTSDDGAKSRKDLIEELIAESKKRKAEKQKLREETVNLTEELDKKWKDLIPVVNKSSGTQEKDSKIFLAEKKTADEYDKAMRALTFEARGRPTDRLKSDDEIAKQEKERLEKLEEDRLARMKGAYNISASLKHRSADDLDDDYLVEKVNDDGINELNDDGKLIEIVKVADENGCDDNSGSEDSGSEDDDNGNEGSGENEENGHSNDDDSSSDDLSDLKHSDEESDDEANNDENINPSTINDEKNPAKRRLEVTEESVPSKKRKTIENVEIKPPINSYPINANIKSDLLMRKEMMEQAREELPFTYDIPDTYEEFDTMFSNESRPNQSVIVERMIKCNHPKLAEGNKDKLSRLMMFILQYFNDIGTNCADSNQPQHVKICFQSVSDLIGHVYDLAAVNPDQTRACFESILREKFDDYRKNPRKFCGVETLIFLKLISSIFSTSDFRHGIVTPAFVFINEMLTRAKVRRRRDASVGLFLTILVSEYTHLSKRFVPSVINFIRGIIHMAVPKSPVRQLKIIPPFSATSEMLVLHEDLSNLNVELYKVMTAEDLLDVDVDSVFKVRILYVTVQLCGDFFDNYKDLSSSKEIFDAIYGLLLILPESYYPKLLVSEKNALIERMREHFGVRTLEFVRGEQKRPKFLRMYEPDIQPVYDDRKRRNQPKQLAERQKLVGKLKKATKTAIRELKKDNVFLRQMVIRDQVRSDTERNAKVKEIFSTASTQQGELNTLERKNKRKR